MGGGRKSLFYPTVLALHKAQPMLHADWNEKSLLRSLLKQTDCMSKNTAAGSQRSCTGASLLCRCASTRAQWTVSFIVNGDFLKVGGSPSWPILLVAVVNPMRLSPGHSCWPSWPEVHWIAHRGACFLWTASPFHHRTWLSLDISPPAMNVGLW